ncbi:MAG TPA: response regulator transcription factor [Candidatus Anoxymicrobiaceae bacterium]
MAANPESAARILVIDDEPEIRKLLRVALGAHGFHMLEAGSGREGLERAALDHPDLIILDMGLPDIDGLEVVKSLREWSTAPIIILSVREQEDQKIAALDAGASDYVTKPFNMGELMARIRVAFRNLVPQANTPIVEIGGLHMDLYARKTTVDGKEVRFTPTEYEVLKYLAINAGKVITHRQLLTHVWGADYTPDIQYLRVYIGQLRKKIEPNPSNPSYIITEPGVGYRLSTPESSA